MLSEKPGAKVRAAVAKCYPPGGLTGVHCLMVLEARSPRSRRPQGGERAPVPASPPRFWWCAVPLPGSSASPSPPSPSRGALPECMSASRFSPFMKLSVTLD